LIRGRGLGQRIAYVSPYPEQNTDTDILVENTQSVYNHFLQFVKTECWKSCQKATPSSLLKFQARLISAQGKGGKGARLKARIGVFLEGKLVINRYDIAAEVA
jgi:hypothetical protein